MRARRNTSLPAEITAVAQRVQRAGGRAILVGGGVIDILQHRVPKDWDLEVYGLDYSDLVRLFPDMHPQTVGKFFGVVKLRAGDLDLDLSLPRTESCVGAGHKDITCAFDAGMPFKEAARRRDFTINSMGMDILTGQILDPFGGMQDLKEGLLRVTDPRTFVEDPLRPLRAMQLLARKARSVDSATMRLIQGMAGEFPHLPKERVYEEFKKLLLKAPRPSVGLRFLQHSGWMRWFSELEALVGCPQNYKWHSEGDAWEHTLRVVDYAAALKHTVPEGQREALMWAALLHDAGKPCTTVREEHVREGKYPAERLYTAYRHEIEGVPLAIQFLQRLTEDKKLLELVAILVGEHMIAQQLYVGNARQSAYLRLHNRLKAAGGDLALLAAVCQSDAGGRILAAGMEAIAEDDLPRVEAMRRYAAKFAADQSIEKPKLLGRHLIEAGFRPGPSFSAALKAAYEAQLEDESLGVVDLLKVATAALAKKNPGTRSSGTFGPYRVEVYERGKDYHIDFFMQRTPLEALAGGEVWRKVDAVCAPASASGAVLWLAGLRLINLRTDGYMTTTYSMLDVITRLMVSAGWFAGAEEAKRLAREWGEEHMSGRKDRT